ncbi:hypothetical protein CCACVL1_10862 [Corchorus capsularis]|uniref:DUF4378 domain-containing protein n=1 Tax=Corchorus capsularis TaxID=210143 RepID=A0A1R3IP52_COCAP|nr:hypothetical protein CCACVL1_10862 [Corchorus capsularis]
MCTPKSATAGCLAGILRRILCSHSLPTHPSDHITEATSVASSYKKKEFSSVDKIDGSKVSPGIVARLMVEKVNQQESSRRVLNVLNEEKLNRRIVDKPNHEVAKCREVNDLSLEAKPIVSAIKSVECSKFMDKKGVPDGAKLRKKKKKIQHCVVQNAENECNSAEGSSPVSVLDFDQFIIDHDVPTSGEESKVEGSNSRRKLSPELENYGCKSPANDGDCLIEDDSRVKDVIEGQNLESRNKVCQSEVNLECWDPICRMIEAEVAKSSWLCSKNEEFEDITANFESNILDQLLDELVLQLLGPTP